MFISKVVYRDRNRKSTLPIHHYLINTECPELAKEKADTLLAKERLYERYTLSSIIIKEVHDVPTIIKIKMSLTKSTKRTHVYKCDDSDAAISYIRIKKETLNKTPPKTITVTVEES